MQDPGGNIVQPHRRNPRLGTLAPNIYVGTLEIPVLERESGERVAGIKLEVRSVKSGYRDDYRKMLEFITEKCTDLLLQAESPVSHSFETDYSKDSSTLYQRFMFVGSIVDTDDFNEAVHRVISSPVTRWDEERENRDVRNIQRFSNADIREITRSGRHTLLPDAHYLRRYGINSLRERINSSRKIDSTDAPENRFIKYVLETILRFCDDIYQIAVKYGYESLRRESGFLQDKLEGYLHHTFFSDISRPSTLRLNSPVLQRKEGYREILRVWLMFDLAAKLIWKGGDDVYKAGKKDVAILYEYWLFFKMIEILQEIYSLAPPDLGHLIRTTPDGLNLQLKQGRFIALQGVYENESRKLKVRFSYNRTFSGVRKHPEAGSWTTTLRPDYTLSVWPHEITEARAEKEELIVHIHFDAKYKISGLKDYISQSQESILSSEELDNEKTENRKGIYKNADLLKMHAYKDAIRRTGGAYVLYPGEESVVRRGFHEVIPGLGAFAVNPSKSNSGISELKTFLREITDHYINRTSQREKIAFRNYEIYKNPPEPEDEVRENLPEIYGDRRGMIPDHVVVLVGFYKKSVYDWICKNNKYNFRMGTGAGSLRLDKEAVSARYLLLHTFGEDSSGELWRIKKQGFRVFSKEDLIKSGYPDPSQGFYLIADIDRNIEPELEGMEWNFKKLKNYTSRRMSARPFTTTLAELMRNKV